MQNRGDTMSVSNKTSNTILLIKYAIIIYPIWLFLIGGPWLINTALVDKILFMPFLLATYMTLVETLSIEIEDNNTTLFKLLKIEMLKVLKYIAIYLSVFILIYLIFYFLLAITDNIIKAIVMISMWITCLIYLKYINKGD